MGASDAPLRRSDTVSTCSRCQGPLLAEAGLHPQSFWPRRSGYVCNTFPEDIGSAGLGPYTEFLRGSVTCPGITQKPWRICGLDFWSCFNDFQGRHLAPGIHLSSVLTCEDWGPGLMLSSLFLCLHRIGPFSLNSRTGKPMPAVSNG